MKTSNGSKGHHDIFTIKSINNDGMAALGAPTLWPRAVILVECSDL